MIFGCCIALTVSCWDWDRRHSTFVLQQGHRKCMQAMFVHQSSSQRKSMSVWTHNCHSCRRPQHYIWPDPDKARTCIRHRIARCPFQTHGCTTKRYDSVTAEGFRLGYTLIGTTLASRQSNACSFVKVGLRQARLACLAGNADSMPVRLRLARFGRKVCGTTIASRSLARTALGLSCCLCSM